MGIQEYRRLVFGLAALRDALQTHLPDIAPGILPRGALIKGIAVLNDPLRARIRALAQGASEPVETDVLASHLGAVLIRRCKALSIPLPRHATKALEADPSGIAMLVTLTHGAQGSSQLSAHRVSA